MTRAIKLKSLMPAVEGAGSPSSKWAGRSADIAAGLHKAKPTSQDWARGMCEFAATKGKLQPGTSIESCTSNVVSATNATNINTRKQPTIASIKAGVERAAASGQLDTVFRVAGQVGGEMAPEATAARIGAMGAGSGMQSKAKRMSGA